MPSRFPPLTLAELEALARSRHAVLLALLRAGVAREQSLVFQALAQLRVVLDERARDAQADSAGLSRDTAAGHRGQDVELVAGLGDREGLANLGAERLGGEKSVERLVVDADDSRARSEKYARGRCLPASGPVILHCCHVKRPHVSGFSAVSGRRGGDRVPHTPSACGTSPRRA